MSCSGAHDGQDAGNARGGLPRIGAQITDARERVGRTASGKQTCVRRFLLTAVALACAAACIGAAAVRAAPPAKVSLGIIFPEGYTVREMTTRVAAVRKIAILKRHVKPVLTAHAYAKAAAHAQAPRPFRSSLTRRSIEGFLFPSRYDFGPV